MTTDIALPDLAIQINQEHAQAEQSARSAIAHAIKAGDLLLMAKAQLKHGIWLDWLKANCTLSERTAQAYMRLAREVPKLDDSKAQRVADLPLRQALAALTERDEDSEDESELDKAKKFDKELARRDKQLRARLTITKKALEAAVRDGDIETLSAIARDTSAEIEAAAIKLLAQRGLGRCLIALKELFPGMSEHDLLDSINSGALVRACNEQIRELSAQGMNS